MTIHWTGTPRGYCQRKDDKSDQSSRTQDNGVEITNLAVAAWAGNVTCPICKARPDFILEAAIDVLNDIASGHCTEDDDVDTFQHAVLLGSVLLARHHGRTPLIAAQAAAELILRIDHGQ